MEKMMKSKYRNHLPQLDYDQLFMTDGGLETTLIYHQKIDLPYFAAFDLLKDAQGAKMLEQYYVRYAAMARAHHLGLVLEAPTWRANPDWGARLGYDAAALAEANRKAISLMSGVRNEFETLATPIVISGCLGPRGDGYRPGQHMRAEEAEAYHLPQIQTFASTEADMVAGFTINYVNEAIGIVRAANACRMPVAISFTLETDGRLPSGDTLQEAIEHTDAETAAAAAYYMINCAHPVHFRHALQRGERWLDRLRGLRANASRRSHAELDACTDLDDGNPHELGMLYAELGAILPQLSVVGGCCGTDERHVEAICRAMALPAADARD
jgi:S-methylmethionine-dependent homocysteine/selenocysteine methylase